MYFPDYFRRLDYHLDPGRKESGWSGYSAMRLQKLYRSIFQVQAVSALYEESRRGSDDLRRFIKDVMDPLWVEDDYVDKLREDVIGRLQVQNGVKNQLQVQFNWKFRTNTILCVYCLTIGDLEQLQTSDILIGV